MIWRVQLQVMYMYYLLGYRIMKECRHVLLEDTCVRSESKFFQMMDEELFFKVNTSLIEFYFWALCVAAGAIHLWKKCLSVFCIETCKDGFIGSVFSRKFKSHIISLSSSFRPNICFFSRIFITNSLLQGTLRPIGSFWFSLDLIQRKLELSFRE